MSNIKFKTERFEETTEAGAKLLIDVRGFEKNNIKGFVSLGIEKNGEFNSAFNDFRIVAGQKGLFLAEPSKEFTNKDGEKDFKSIYVAPKALKDDLLARIIKRNS